MADALSPEQETELQQALERLDRELEESLSVSGESAKTVDLDEPIGRLSRMDAMQQQQMALELKRRKEQYRLRLENALKRMDQGTYGRCRRCRGLITAERLEIQPDAVLCVRCAAPK